MRLFDTSVSSHQEVIVINSNIKNAGYRCKCGNITRNLLYHHYDMAWQMANRALSSSERDQIQFKKQLC